jgi:hypothetical protein
MTVFASAERQTLHRCLGPLSRRAFLFSSVKTVASRNPVAFMNPDCSNRGRFKRLNDLRSGPRNSLAGGNRNNIDEPDIRPNSHRGEQPTNA